MGVNARYKDSVFSFLFSSPETLRELYGAIEGTPLDPQVSITVNTLSDVLYMEQYNDISFTIDDKLVILIEHQSTVNPNMPLRLLLYIARVYEKIIERKNLYRERLLKIPRPEFIVLYNGARPYPDKKILKLSDAFETATGLKAADISPELDLAVKIYNINMGHNEEILRKSENLRGYSAFVDKIRENRAAMPLDEAMKAAIEYCIERNILSAFLLERSSEVFNMLLTEWNTDEAKEVWREEAMMEGMEKGMEKGREDKAIEIARKLMSAGLPLDTISETTGLDLESVKKLAAR
jgi:predicted transposase/invertase (TIGR01784 family)